MHFVTWLLCNNCNNYNYLQIMPNLILCFNTTLSFLTLYGLTQSTVPVTCTISFQLYINANSERSDCFKPESTCFCYFDFKLILQAKGVFFTFILFMIMDLPPPCLFMNVLLIRKELRGEMGLPFSAVITSAFSAVRK